MIKILVVDDNELNQELLVRRLRPENYEVSVASSGPEAIDMIDEEDFDLVLLDIVMPDMDGLEVLSIIRKTKSLVDLPVIIVTAKDLDEDIVSAFELGANDYVTKPLNMSIALVRIQAHVRLKRLAQLHKEFLGVASHDMKRPLALILDIMETLLEDPPDGITLTDSVSGTFSLVIKACQQMQSNITDYLDRHAIENGQIKLNKVPTDLNVLVRQVYDCQHESAGKKGVNISLNFDEQIAGIFVDQSRMTQVVDNLIGNAIKFSQPDTKTILRTRQDNGKVFFEVIDSGPGLSDEDLANVFEKFARLSAQPTGGEVSSGLGLSICKQIIDLHHGDIGATNREDQIGAVFWISLAAFNSANY
jgi:two-component system, sensor histidine kinase and response regulator